MTYSIFDSTGNFVDAFTQRAAALECLAGIAQAEVYLVAQDEHGNLTGETVYSSALSGCA